MAVIQIRKAKREGARLVIGISGISGSGKTRSAIEVAYGMANYNPEKIGFLDTENKRGSLYAEVLREHATHPTDVEFFIGDLEPPFTPQRYAEAILEFQKAGVEILVIDSVSHEYEGTGGVLEMREPLPGKQGKRDNLAKSEHKKFMNTMLQCNMHIIACVRAREKVELKQEGGKTIYIPKGVQPICEKNFMFEMTASLMMWDEGTAQQILKCPGELRQILGRETGYLTSEDGKALRDWVDGAKQLDPVVEAARNTLRTTTEQGMAALVDAWTKLPAKIKKAINPSGCPEEFKAAAKAFDDQRNQTGETDGVDDLNAQIMAEHGNAAEAAE